MKLYMCNNSHISGIRRQFIILDKEDGLTYKYGYCLTIDRESRRVSPINTRLLDFNLCELENGFRNLDLFHRGFPSPSRVKQKDRSHRPPTPPLRPRSRLLPRPPCGYYDRFLR